MVQSILHAPERGQQQELLTFPFWTGAVPLLAHPSECPDPQLDRGSAVLVFLLVT